MPLHATFLPSPLLYTCATVLRFKTEAAQSDSVQECDANEAATKINGRCQQKNKTK